MDNNTGSERRESRKWWFWGLVPAAAAVWLACFPVRSFDTWMHLATARYIVQTGTIPRTDVFLYTAEGRPWVNHSWVSQILFYLAYRAAEVFSAGHGTVGLILSKMALAGLGAFLFWLVAVRRGARLWVAALVTAALVSISAPHFLSRPRMFAPALAAGIILCLLHPSWPRIALAMVLQLLWANAHGSFPLGIVVAGAMAIGHCLTIKLGSEEISEEAAGNWKLAILAVPLTLIVSLVNPNLHEAFTYSWHVREATWIRELVTEWSPPNFAFPGHFRFLIAAICVWGLAAARWIKQRKTEPADVLLLALLTYSAFDARRFIGLWGFFAIPVAATAVDGLLPEKKRLRLLAGVLIGIVATAVFANVLAENFRHHWIGWGVQTDNFPVRAVRFMKESGISGNVACSAGAGGYLEWTSPECRPATDGRGLANDPDTTRAFNALSYNQPGWEKVFPPPGVSDVMLINHCNATPINSMTKEWAVVHWDEKWEVLLRRGGQYDHLIKENILTLTAPNVMPHIYESLTPVEKKEVVEYLQWRIAADPGCGTAHALLAYVYYLGAIELLGKTPTASAETRSALEKSARDLFLESARLFKLDTKLTTRQSRSLYGMARNLVWLGRPDETHSLFESAGVVDPLNWVHAKDSVEYHLAYLHTDPKRYAGRIQATNKLLDWVKTRARRNRSVIARKYRRMRREEEMPEWLSE